MLVEHTRDWRSHLSHTYVFVDNDKTATKDLFWVEDVQCGLRREVAFDELVLYGRVVASDTKNEYGELRPKLKKASYGFPVLGMGDQGDYCVYAFYTPRRQWRKSLHPKLYEFSCPSIRQLDDRKAAVESVSFQALWHMVNKQYLPIKEASRQVREGRRVSVAVSPTFCIANAVGTAHPALVHKNMVCGYMDKTDTPVFMQAASFLIEAFSAGTKTNLGDIKYAIE